MPGATRELLSKVISLIYYFTFYTSSFFFTFRKSISKDFQHTLELFRALRSSLQEAKVTFALLCLSIEGNSVRTRYKYYMNRSTCRNPWIQVNVTGEEFDAVKTASVFNKRLETILEKHTQPFCPNIKIRLSLLVIHIHISAEKRTRFN